MNCRRQALKLCFDAAAVVVIQIFIGKNTSAVRPLEGGKADDFQIGVDLRAVIHELLKQRQAALHDSIDKADHVLLAVSVIAFDYDVHQSV